MGKQEKAFAACPNETCQYCAHEHVDIEALPCSQCSCNYMSQFKRKPLFTEDEVATMRVLYAAGIRTVERDKYATLWMGDDGRAKSTALPYGMFHSIRPGQSVEIGEIVGEARG